jgi:hypothetical protein
MADRRSNTLPEIRTMETVQGPANETSFSGIQGHIIHS